MKTLLYPLKFQPILKDKIWGGEKLHRYLNKNSNSKQLGESWEISAVPGDISIVSNGEFKGKPLQELLEMHKSDLLGSKNYKRFANNFPLLIKFIDAKEDLSIQLHPNDELAKKRHNSLGKTEMWYVMQADKDSNLIVGFNQEMNKETYLQHLESKTLTSILNFDRVKEGDTYFIEAGRLHAIGAGVLLAEIQQTSDVTYRVYDWDRVDDKGNERDLHNDIAIDAFDFNMKDNFRVDYKKRKNVSNEMVSCPFFTTNFIELDSKIEKQNLVDSFIIYLCVDGEVEVITEVSNEIIAKGETLLLPAAIKKYNLNTKYAKLLEVYV
ncbi:class I mannose-6-phosphate isomerase [Winogradskyella echinorum]|uniref:Phosphohexomutase n=1 Tax=Winogradskyella echinorum TaxID=538189 RepID=A0ABR6Y2V9_9FLAO|nr:type I phosphomannose isomerase catalytic subunit [Winogradskyella echinorum]MBC3847073.1 class I mannose-6-phosphate isomerase [Winogradskyella echinorum]MBC5751421.1 class I mannose-6-phosphate isomerase [Winogradskyella echinorum]